MLQRIALVLFVTCTTCALCCSDDGEKTVALCRESYLQTKQAIKSVSCDVVTESYQEAGISPSGIAMPAQVTQTKLTWKESAGVIKCVESSTSGDYSRKEEFLWNDQVFKHVKRDSQTKDVYGQFFDHTGQYSSFSIWRDGFLESNHEAVERLKTKPLKYEGVEEVAGAPCYKISMDQGNATEYLWFDPKKNYLIRRTQYHPSYNKKIYFEREIEKVIEAKPGIWFPVQSTSRHSNKGKITVTSRTTFRNVVVNGPIPESTFQLKFPSGAKVNDNRNATYYVVGENEEPVGPVVPKPVPRNAAPAEVQMPTGVTMNGLVDESETPYWVWVIGGIGVVVIGGVVGFGRRLRG